MILFSRSKDDVGFYTSLDTALLWTRTAEASAQTGYTASAGGSTQGNITEQKQVNVQVIPERPILNEAKFALFKKRFDAIPAKEKGVLRILMMQSRESQHGVHPFLSSEHILPPFPVPNI